MSRVAAASLVLLVVLGGAGCGSSSGAATPALATGLGQVDAAAVADDPKALASAVAGLLRAVDEAEDAGDLSAADAERIRRAAASLLDAAAPDGRSEPDEPTSTPPPDEDEGEQDEPADEDDEGDEGDESGPEKGHGKGKGKAKGHGKGH